MEDRLIYLESDEEITSVIDKISKASSPEVALVIPRGGNLGQSIVNLKLLKKRSADLGKDVSLVTSDKISRNLASQVGISVYSKVEEVGKRKAEPIPVVAPVMTNQPETIKSDVPAPEAKKPVEEIPEIPGVRINRYYDQRPQQSKVDSPKSKEEQLPEEIIAPVQEIEPQAEEVTPELAEEIVEQEETEKLSETIEPEPEEETSPIEVTQVTEADEIPKSEFKNRSISDVSSPIPEVLIEDQVSREKILKPIRQAQGVREIEPQVQDDKGGAHNHKKQAVGRRFMPMRKRRALTIIIAAALVVILAFGYLLLPHAKVTIAFKADNFEESADIQLDKAAASIDQEKLISPATESSVEKEVSDTFQATGKKNIGNKASGEITFYNYIDLTADKISSGSTLTANGKSFVTDGDITIPAVAVTSVIPFASTPGSVKGKIIAADSGEDSNLPSGTKFSFTAFSGNKQNNVYGQSTAALSGGSTQEVQVVQASDISAAQDKIKARLSAEAKDEVLKKIPSVDKYVEGTIDEKITDLTSSISAGAQAPTFTYKGKIKTTLLSFNETILKDAIIAKYESKLPANRVMVQRDKLTFDYQVAAKDLNAGTAQYKVGYKGKISSKIDQSALREQLRGKSIDEAKKILSGLDLAQDVSISMTPNLSIYKTLPLLARSINIDTVYQAD